MDGIDESMVDFQAIDSELNLDIDRVALEIADVLSGETYGDLNRDINALMKVLCTWCAGSGVSKENMLGGLDLMYETMKIEVTVH